MDFLKRNAFTHRPNSGWLSCGYGAFRRLSGSSANSTDIEPLHRRFLTLFEEGAALQDCVAWLKELDRKALRGGDGSPEQAVLEEAKEALVALLPGIAAIEVGDEITFRWRDGTVGLERLSDGYRSMFALAVDLLRWIVELRPLGTPLREAHGVVLVDEIDAHLHPRWQREAGFLFTRVFPNIQFIVTSHSPFVAMAAGEGCLTLLERRGDTVVANQDVPYVRGWAVDQVLTEVFGLVSIRDPETTDKLEEYQRLRLDRRAGRLSETDRGRLDELEKELNERLAGDRESPREQEMDEDLSAFAAAVERKKAGTTP